MNARSLESRRRTPTKSASSTFWGMMMCANDTRKIFHRSIEEKRYFERAEKERETRKLFIRERERERIWREGSNLKNFFAAIDFFLVVPKLFVSFSFFSSSPAFFSTVGCFYRQEE